MCIRDSVNTLEGHGGNFRELLKNGKDGHFPQYMVRVKVGNDEEITYFSDEKSLMSFCQNNRDLRLLNEDLTEEEIEAYRETFEGVQRRAIKYELHESVAIGKILERLNELGLKTDPFYSDDLPIYELVEGEGDQMIVDPVFNLFEILDRILDIGKRGMRIQRFKGLGEMNAKELYATTMDPETRTFLRVQYDHENFEDANVMFDVLMGDVVEPRKRFIEDNALKVQNLDV